MVAFGAVFIGLAWIINSQATSLMGFYIGAAVGGIGVGRSMRLASTTR